MPARPRSDDDGVDATVEEIYEIQVVDMFGRFSPRPIFSLPIVVAETSSVEVRLDPRANGVVPALILAEMIPCAPWAPTVAIKTRVLEAYRVTHVRCPQLAIQAFVKSLCDLHGVGPLRLLVGG